MADRLLPTSSVDLKVLQHEAPTSNYRLGVSVANVLLDSNFWCTIL